MYTADCPAKITHGLRRHYEKLTNVYSTTTNDKRRSHPDILFSESIVSFPDSPFKFPLLISSRFLDSLVLAFGIVKLLHPVRLKQRV